MGVCGFRLGLSLVVVGFSWVFLLFFRGFFLVLFLCICLFVCMDGEGGVLSSVFAFVLFCLALQ